MNNYTRKELLELLKENSILGFSSKKKKIIYDKAVELKLINSEIKKIESPPCLSNECWIPLKDKNKNIVKWTLISIEDYDNVSKYSWSLSSVTGKNYAMSRCTRLHNFLLGEPPENQVVDHINGDGLDNRRENIRFVTRKVNVQNRMKESNTSSKYIGVYKVNNKWRAMSEHTHLGYFVNEKHAAYAYDEHIRINMPGGRVNNIDKPSEYKPYVKKQSKSKTKNVFLRPNGKYQASHYDIENKKTVYIGTYESEELANKALQSYIKKLPSIIYDITSIFKEITRNNDNIAIIPAFSNIDKKTHNVLVDDDVWHEFIKKKWLIDSSGYVYSNIIFNGIYKMHHFILKPSKKYVVDHIFNKLDNRKIALRYNTYSGNSHHRKAISSTGMKGVTKVENVFAASINCDKKIYYLGRYKSALLAAHAYNFASIQLYGIFASPNTVEEIKNIKWDSDKMRLIIE